MKSKIFLFAFLLAVTFSAKAMAADAAAPSAKYAYVDVAKVFDGYQKTKDNDQVLQSAGKKKELERDNLVHEIRQLKDELVLLREDAKAKKQEQMNAKVKLLEDFDASARQDLGEQRNKVVREIFKDIDDAVQRYGQRKGLDMIFNERSLVFHNPTYDLSKDVLDELNKEYVSKKKK